MNDTHPSSETLTLFAYGESLPEARSGLEAHLAACASCRAELEAVRRAMDALDALPVEEPTAEQWRRLQEGVAAATASSPVAPRARIIALRNWRSAAVAATFLLGLSLGVILMWRAGATLPPPSPLASAAARFSEAEALEIAGRNEEARTALSEIARRHAGTDWAELAAFHLRTLDEKRIVAVKELPDYFNPGGPRIAPDKVVVIMKERWNQEIAFLRYQIDLNEAQPDRNAMRLVMIGEILDLRLAEPAAAAESYRKAIALAPSGPVAELAERRLERLGL